MGLPSWINKRKRKSSRIIEPKLIPKSHFDKEESNYNTNQHKFFHDPNNFYNFYYAEDESGESNTKSENFESTPIAFSEDNNYVSKPPSGPKSHSEEDKPTNNCNPIDLTQLNFKQQGKGSSHPDWNWLDYQKFAQEYEGDYYTEKEPHSPKIFIWSDISSANEFSYILESKYVSDLISPLEIVASTSETPKNGITQQEHNAVITDPVKGRKLEEGVPLYGGG